MAKTGLFEAQFPGMEMCILRHITPGTAAALRAVTCGKTWRLPRLGVGQPPRDHVCVTKQNTEAAAAVRICARTAGRERAELLERLRPCFARVEPWLQAGKYLGAVMSELPERNGWSVARLVGDRTPDKTQRLLNRACWDTFAAMGEVRRFAVAGLDEAARKGGRRRGHLVIGALDETGQEKKGECTAGVKRQHMGCADGIANGINTVHLSYVREKTGHALIGARQWVPREHIADPVKSLTAGLPLDLEFRTKGQLATDICAEATADGVTCDFYCGDEVYGNCTELREYFETSDQAYVLRVPSNFRITLRSGTVVTCAEAVATLLKHPRRWEIRSAGKGSKGDRWYAWAWIGTASPRHHLLIRRHIRTGELAFHYCFMPEGQLCTKTRLIAPPACGGLSKKDSNSVRTASASTSPRSGCTPRSPGMPSWSWPPGNLRGHRGPAPRPYRYPGAPACAARPGTARRPRHDPADRARGQAHPRRPRCPALASRPRRALGRLDPHPPGSLTMVPPAHQTRPRR